jgi:addiction module RelB/DinJ family antitoxin
MKTAVINIKTEAKTKSEAQRVAGELGISLSAVINGFLKQFVRTKTVTFGANDEIPNKKTAALLKKAEKDYKEGNTSPAFDNLEDAIEWLHK